MVALYVMLLFAACLGQAQGQEQPMSTKLQDFLQRSGRPSLNVHPLSETALDEVLKQVGAIPEKRAVPDRFLTDQGKSFLRDLDRRLYIVVL